MNLLYKDSVLLDECLRLWGEDTQVDMLIEEMSELTFALLKARRAGKGTITSAVVEELTDVSIVLEEIRRLAERKGYDLSIPREEKMSRLANLVFRCGGRIQ